MMMLPCCVGFGHPNDVCANFLCAHNDNLVKVTAVIIIVTIMRNLTKSDKLWMDDLKMLIQDGIDVKVPLVLDVLHTLEGNDEDL